jgi:Tfp pilus assembly protein PilX
MNNHQDKGFSIYLVMIIVSMMLSVSLNVGTIIVNSAKMSGNLGDGVRAFHVADSGVEHALYHVTRASYLCDDFNANIAENTNYAYSVVVDDGPNGTCPASSKIVSTGIYKATKRVLEVKY